MGNVETFYTGLEKGLMDNFFCNSMIHGPTGQTICIVDPLHNFTGAAPTGQSTTKTPTPIVAHQTLFPLPISLTFNKYCVISTSSSVNPYTHPDASK